MKLGEFILNYFMLNHKHMIFLRRKKYVV